MFIDLKKQASSFCKSNDSCIAFIYLIRKNKIGSLNSRIYRPFSWNLVIDKTEWLDVHCWFTDFCDNDMRCSLRSTQ